MKSVFRLHPYELKKKLLFLNKMVNLQNSYNFLDIIKDKYDIDINIYYQIIDYQKEFTLKNLLYFINLRLKKINLQEIKYKEKLTHNDLNDILNEFINNNIVNGIIVMNLLTHFIYP